MANAILSTAIFVCIVALVAMVVAHALPYWTEFETGYLGGIKGHYGLWIGCMEYAVVQFNECAHDLTSPSVFMIVTRVMACVATVCLLLPIILSVVFCCRTKKYPTILGVGATFSLAAGFLTAVGVAVYGMGTFLNETLPLQNRSTETKSSLLAGFYIAIVAGALSLLSGMLFIIAKWRINGELRRA